MRISRILHVLALLGLLAACSRGGEPAVADPTPAAKIEVPQGGTLAIRLSQEPGPLRPWAPASREEEQMVGLLYRGLTRLDADLAPQPDIATGWQSDVSGRVLTMTLRTDIRWHDGEPLTAADVRWTLTTLRAITPTTTLLADLRQVISAVETPLSDTLVLRLNEPYAPLLAELSTPILPQHLFGSRPAGEIAGVDFWEQAVGSGPFRFEKREPGSAILFVRNNRYADGVPHLDRVAFVVAPDPAVAAKALGEGDLLAAELPWAVTEPLSRTRQAALRIGAYPENGYYYLAFNLREGRLFSDSRVRAALAAVLPLPAIAGIAGPQAMPIWNDHLPGSWAAPATPPEAPPASEGRESARALLAEAGWVLPPGEAIRASNGITLSAALYVRGDDARRIEVAERIAGAAATIGIDLRVTPGDFESVIKPKLAPPFDFEIALMSWGNSRVRPDGPSYAAYDPDNFALFHSSQIYQGVADARPGLRNYVGFANTSFDNLSTAARSLYDLGRRRELYQQTGEILMRERPYIFLWADRIPVALSSSLKSTEGDIRLDTPNWLSGVQHWYIER